MLRPDSRSLPSCAFCPRCPGTSAATLLGGRLSFGTTRLCGWTSAAAACLLAPPSARARAEPASKPVQYGATAAVVRPMAARNEEDATAAATSIDLTQRPMALE